MDAAAAAAPNNNHNRNTRRQPAMDRAQVAERVRFELELEFVQCLANPDYLKCWSLHATHVWRRWDSRVRADLAQGLYLQDEAFIGHLQYLRSHWKTPEYAQYLIYPACLKFLDLLLDHANFRTSLKNSAVCDAIQVQQFQHWQHRNR
jgi:mediator of RNA polymerase II transcription subunit 31